MARSSTGRRRRATPRPTGGNPLANSSPIDQGNEVEDELGDQLAVALPWKVSAAVDEVDLGGGGGEHLIFGTHTAITGS